MGYRIREFAAESKFIRHLSLDAIARAVPVDEIMVVLAEQGAHAQRERKLNALTTVLLVIAMNIYAHLSIAYALRKLVQGLRFIWPGQQYEHPGPGAISYRRYQLGAKPLVALYKRLCRPLATPQTQGAFLYGLRLMAIDGTIEDVADTPANVAAFGRHYNQRGPAAFPQVQCVYLAECGTHAIVDAGVWPCHVSEHKGSYRLLRSLAPGMLVMWDCGLHSYDLVKGVLERQSHVLARIPAGVLAQPVQFLADGSYLAYIRSSARPHYKHGQPIKVRIIEYTITDPNRPGYGERHRLLTTLLDAQECPALALICAYHERWEIEVTIDEVDTHQRLLDRPFRSLKPVGVIQEVYGLLLAHYAVRYLMHEAAVQADVDPDRLSFVHALRVLQDAIPECQMVSPEQLPLLHERLLADISEERLPERRNRINPRVVKRKMSNFDLKRAEHYWWPQPKGPFRDAIALI